MSGDQLDLDAVERVLDRSGRLPSPDARALVAEVRRLRAERVLEERCDYPECDQPAVALLANDAPLMSADYAERLVCRWHRLNAFPA